MPRLIFTEDGDFYIEWLDHDGYKKRTEKNILWGDWMPDTGERLQYLLIEVEE